MLDSEDWDKLEEFAKEQGFEVMVEPDPQRKITKPFQQSTNNFRYILLPLDKISIIEYGLCIEKPFLGDIGIDNICPYFRRLDVCGSFHALKIHRITCFTPEIIIRTAELNNNKYIIEKEKLEKEYNNARGLILAFKHKNLSTIDNLIVEQIYNAVIGSIAPKGGGRELLINKISELEEKLEEVEALTSELPGEDIEKIKKNIYNEMSGYVKVARTLGVDIMDKIKRHIIYMTMYNLKK